jgi:TPR repeat protein
MGIEPGMKALAAFIISFHLYYPSELLAQEHQRRRRGEASATHSGANLESLRVKAGAGEAEAQFDLGLYLYDQRREYAEGKEWLRRSAENGHPRGQYWYAWILHLNKEFVEAAKWFRRAADQGHAEAQWRLGTYYHGGRGGLPKDLATAAEWYRRAVAQGHEGAKVQLAQVEHSPESASVRVDREVCAKQPRAARLAGSPSPQEVCRALERHIVDRLYSLNVVSAQLLHRLVTGEASMIESGIYVETFKSHSCANSSQTASRFVCSTTYRLGSEREAPVWFELFGKGQDLDRSLTLERVSGSWEVLEVQ